MGFIAAASRGHGCRCCPSPKDAVLVPSMNVQSAAETFQRAGAEELAVVEDFTDRKVVGLLTEGHLMRRYAEELDKARRDLSGEG